ncbi:MAG: hypothetical protein ACI9N1_001241 [Flavobacteriales bacterium]|jgi:hypothetical protein
MKYYLNINWWNTLRVLVLVISSVLLGGDFCTIYSQKVVIKQVKLAKFDENAFASAIVDGKMFVCSDKSTKSMRNVSNENGTKFLSIYQIEIDKEKTKGKMKELPATINNKLNQGPIFIDKKNNKAYYSSNVKQNEEGDYKLELYSVDYRKGVFSNPVPLELIGSKFNSAHPIIIDDGHKIIFTSDLNGAFSQSDLFMCIWDKDHWTAPQLIPKINSSKTETFPTFFNNTLYFSSDRSDGYGGLDLYQSDYVNGEFQKPELMIEPINSELDDFLYIVKDASSGYFSSNRKSGFDRVFYFDYQIPTPDKFEEQSTTFCYQFTDEDAENNDSLIYTWYFGDENSLTGNTVKHCYNQLGEFNVYCDILDVRNNQTFNKAAEYQISIKATTPIIQWQKSSDDKNLTVYVEQKYSLNAYLEWYWILNGEIIMDKTLLLDLSKYESLDVKLVCYDSENKLPVIGLHKKLR